jgi:hypothetical protein
MSAFILFGGAGRCQLAVARWFCGNNRHASAPAPSWPDEGKCKVLLQCQNLALAPMNTSDLLCGAHVGLPCGVPVWAAHVASLCGVFTHSLFKSSQV